MELSHNTVESLWRGTSAGRRSDEAESDRSPPALELRCQTVPNILGRLRGLGGLRVLVLAGSNLTPDALATVISGQRRLEKLDASQCGLVRLPVAELWAGLSRLKLLFLHQNELQRWEDVVGALQPPALAWLTFFSNPISSQPECRSLVVRRQPSLLALDYWLVLDSERLDPSALEGAEGAYAGQPGFRFTAMGALVPFTPASHQAEVHEDAEQSKRALLMEAAWQFRTLQHCSNRCSAACCVQAFWRSLCARRRARHLRQRLERAALVVQRHWGLLTWRRRVTDHVKDYLAEIDELDLLLSAKEMLRRKAMKLIEVSVHRWWDRRKLKKRERKAAEVINRNIRGWLARLRTFHNTLELDEFPRLYFPQRNAWEFLVLLNIVRQRHGLPPLPLEHRFEGADFLGVRFPEAEETSIRSSSLLAILRFGRCCLVRPRRAGRHPEHAWDGPAHRLVGREPEHVCGALTRLKRRGAHVDNRCRQAFLNSCVSGLHPMDMTGEEPPKDCLALKLVLDGPESQWPEEAQREESLLNTFFQEAKRTGNKTYRQRVIGVAAPHDKETGTRVYQGMCWLTLRLVCHPCESARIAVDLAMTLLRFTRLVAGIPSLEAVPFLPEKLLRKISSVTMLQAALRAHWERRSLGCGLLQAALIRRSAICIQRYWRWSIMKRRLDMLAGAAACVRKVRTTCMYVEERLLAALHLINSVDRYPPMVEERSLRFGYSEAAEAVALVNSEQANSWRGRLKESGRMRSRRTGLPRWLLARVGGLSEASMEDRALRRMSGLLGLLTEGVERNEDLVTVSITSFQHMHSVQGGTLAGPSIEEALHASDGQLRFVELRFHSLAQARQRAFLLYMCTFNSRYRTVVPMLPRQVLHESSTFRSVLRQWELYGLDWAPSNRVAMYQLRQATTNRSDEVVQCCGGQSLEAITKPSDWGQSEDKLAHGWESRRMALHKALCARYQPFAQQVTKNRQIEEERLLLRLQALDTEGACDALAAPPAPTGMGEVCILGAVPPMTSLRAEAVPADLGRAEKAAAADMVQSARDQDMEQKKSSREAVIEWQTKGKVGLEFEERLMSHYAPQRRDEERHQQVSAPAPEEEEIPSRTPFYIGERHMRAEKKISNKAQMLHKAAEARRFREERGCAILEKAQEHFEEVQGRRERIRLEKAEKAARKECKDAMQRFLGQRACLERVCQRADVEELRLQREEEAMRSALRLRRSWAKRSRQLAEKNHDCLQQRRRQVDELRQQLEALQTQRRQQDEEELERKRMLIEERAAIDDMIKSTKVELERYYADSTLEPFEQAKDSYENTLQAFRKLTQHVGSIVAGSLGPIGESTKKPAGGGPPPPKGRRSGSAPPPRAGTSKTPMQPAQAPSPGPTKPVLPALTGTKALAGAEDGLVPVSSRLEANAWLQRIRRSVPLSAR